MDQYVLALDQGTTSSRAIVFNRAGRVVSMAQREFPQLYPRPGEVEHDPEAIWQSQWEVGREALTRGQINARQIVAIGIANQRETTLLWERATGKPVAPAIVWQSRVSAPECDRLRAQGLSDWVRQRTGLVIDAYFSGTKIKHLLDTIPGLRTRAERGDILFGTVDTFLLWRLTGGRCHYTDYSNASRTLLFNIHTLEWDEELLRLLDIPAALLPKIRPSSEVYGVTDESWFDAAIPVAGMAGDQQAATFGQGCFSPGSAKNTYGTGCFLLLNTGSQPVASRNQLLTTVGWMVQGQITYCLEGSVFIAGATVQWLRDGLKAIRASAEIEALAASVPDSGGIFLVPAFVGLGAPYWDAEARGLVIGLTRDTQLGHIARAAVEAMAYQSRDVLDAMRRDAALDLQALKVDGGAVVNNDLLQFQADLLGVAVERPVVSETTALGAAYLAGLAVGYWQDLQDISANWALDRRFEPRMPLPERERRYRDWTRAVSRARGWNNTEE